MVERTIRAGDEDRERVAEALRGHFTAGRLDHEEFEERLDAAYRARTMGDLEDLVVDLPADPRVYALPVPADDRSGARPLAHRGGTHEVTRPEPREVASYLGTSAVCLAVWLALLIATGAVAAFWPVWVIGPWGAILAVRALLGGDDGGEPGR